jgi:4-methyl-5(b-hydroxyethyl)-thiazole monophosphate biosynthesis
MKKAIILLANGFEDIEAITPIDYFRRAGIEVVTASITKDNTVTSRWGEVKLITSTTLFNNKKFVEAKNWDAVIIPGGIPGAPNIAASQEATTLIKNMAAAGKLVCAICASPVLVLAPLGLLAGKTFTCYPGLEAKIEDGKWSDARVVVDDNIITSRSAGTAGEFSLTIIEKLLGEEEAKKLAEMVLL